MSSLASALRAGPLVLDGGLSTELENRGQDISGRLWSARLLDDAPEAIVEVHSAFLRAGAQVITTASYQATPEGFAQAGYEPSAGEALLRRSVELAHRARDQFDSRDHAHLPGQKWASVHDHERDGSAHFSPQPSRDHAEEARQRRPFNRTGDQSLDAANRDPAEPKRETWVAGSVGPYGALLANGSEYTGDYGPDVDLRRLRGFHRPRLEILAEAGADVLAAETVPSLLETEALILELAALGHPAWLSLTVTTDGDGTVRTRRNELAAEAFAMAADVDAIIAVGVNCTEPAGLAATIEVAARASGKPVISYPNSGEGWDAEARTWTGRSASDSGFSEPAIRSWLDAGARMIGGCCRVGPDVIADLTRQLAARPRF